MADIMFHVTTIAVIAVLIVLIIGLWTMMKGKSANMSQKLMRWRVGLQFVAILAIMVTLFFRQ